ncbi:MAG: HlyD family type I secretion periplasmic adaptor subunit [Magnetococcales bacterium]|nr:HlyD family type I secretion periplasmic adaptor subunit [Magnetococcales bacterium]MBF0115982.1 HlyD family type I secretion periplasmic adaptor subunit [Magnetococcales bacterium]
MTSRHSVHRFADAVTLEEAVISWKVRLALVVTLCFTLLFASWSAMTHVDEAVKANGQFVPQGLIYRVQSSEAGILSSIAVKEGDRVEKGDLLLKLNNAPIDADEKQALARMAGLQARRIRLQALLTGTEADFSSIDSAYSDLIRDQASLLRTQIAARESNLSVIDTQLIQKKTECEQLANQIHTAKGRVEVDRALLALQEELANKKLVAEVTRLNAKRTYLSSQADWNRLQNQYEKATQALDEVKKRRRTTEAESRQQGSDELGQVNSDIAQAQELLNRLQERRSLMEIRTPVAGAVQGLRTQTVGAVIKAGDVLMQIVPADTEMMLEVRIPPKDIGFVHPDLPVVIKVNSYDFGRFGTISGLLLSVSPSTELQDGQAEKKPFYRGIIRPDTRFVGSQQYPILPGMSAEADIITGERSVLAYLLKPLLLPHHGKGERIEEMVHP